MTVPGSVMRLGWIRAKTEAVMGRGEMKQQLQQQEPTRSTNPEGELAFINLHTNSSRVWHKKEIKMY